MNRGFEVTYLKPDEQGVIQPEMVQAALREDGSNSWTAAALGSDGRGGDSPLVEHGPVRVAKSVHSYRRRRAVDSRGVPARRRRCPL